MTSAVTYPDFWVPGQTGFPNVENLLQTLFTGIPQFDGVVVKYWLPSESDIDDILASGQAILRIFRTGGKVNRAEKRDEPNVQVAALSNSRDDSWELIEFVRTGVLELGYAEGSVVPGTIHKLHYAGEVLGPQLIPEQYRDERLVPATFTLHTWKPKGLERYRGAIGL